MNFYIDESCHLLKDDSDYMVLGSLFCDKSNVRYISKQIKQIKKNSNIPASFEIKSTKVSESKAEFYLELLQFFISCDYLHYRAVVINKKQLRHDRFNQTHDEFYYKMMYILMKKAQYGFENNIYIDYKDVLSFQKSQKLKEYLNRTTEFNEIGIEFSAQPINSKESLLMQMCDLITGLVTYAYRGLNSNAGKLKMIVFLENELDIKLNKLNYNRKLNIFEWKGRK